MKSNKLLLFFTFLIQINLISCSKYDNVKEDIVGQYRIEKKGIEIMDSTNGKEAAKFLKINSDNTFTLYNSYEKKGLLGEWKILTCRTIENNLGENVPESIIEFKINKQKSLAAYCDRRLTFEYPKNLYGERYKVLWYVKLNMKR
jgi:hypothetical protein